MGIRIATAPLGPRNDRRCYIVRRDSLSSSVIARSEATRQSVFSVGTACTHLSVGLAADSSPQGEPRGAVQFKGGSLGAACCGRISAPAGIKKLHPFGWSSLCWRYLSSRPVTRQVLSAKVCLTSVFGMGTGGPTPQSTPTSFLLSTQLYPEN